MKHKQTLRRGLSVLLALVLCLSLLPAAALAEGTATTDQTADFTDSDNISTALTLLTANGGTATWSENKLTLNGVNFTSTASVAVALPAGAKIVLAEGTTNTITSTNSYSNQSNSFGIDAKGSLTIEGSGTLIVTGGAAETTSFGIYLRTGDLTINGGTVKATGGTSMMTYGIQAYGSATISGGTVTAIGGTSTVDGSASYGIFAGEGLTINSGIVTATGSQATYSRGIGASTGQTVNITGGTVIATGGTAQSESNGIFAYMGNITISGGHVTAQTVSTTGEKSALNEEPDLSGYTGYRWRTSAEDEYTDSTITKYAYDATNTYVEFSQGATVTTYTVSFDANGGSGSMDTKTGVSGRYTLPACTFTAPEGKRFKGWATSANGEVISDTSITVTGDTTLYAIWEDIPTITFDANGGTLNEGSNSSIKTEANGTVDYLAAATREGYTFDGWYTEDGDKVYTFITVFTADTTVYAHWTHEDDTKQITEASFAMTGYTVGANAKDIVVTSHTEGLSLIGGYYEAQGKPFSYVLCEFDGENLNNLTEVAGSLKAGKNYVLMVKADVNAGYETSGLTAAAVTLNGTIAAYECDADVIGEACASCVFILPKLTGGGSSGSSGGSTSTPTEPEITTDGGTTVAGIETEVTTSGTTSTATVSQDTLEKAVEAAESAAGQANTNAAVEIAVETPAQATEVKVDLPAEGLESFAGSEAQSLIISSGVGAVTISDQAAASIAGQAQGDTVTVTISAVTQPEKILNERQLAAVGDAPVYDLSITSSGTYISQFGGGSVTVSLPYTLKEDQAPNGVVVYYVDDLGNIQRVQATYDEETQSIIFTTNHFSLYMVRYEANAAAAARFTDVPFDAYYQSAVGWAVNQGITTGTTATTFSPDASCTRAQMVTFLWRAAGSPKVSGSNPFSDVSADAYYYDAVLWAVEKGITSGTSATTFAPDATVTRGQTVTFLYREAGSPAASGSGFSDVSSDAYYADAVAWAVQQNITTGTGDGKFSPDADCTRAQIVTFLFRAMGE